MANISIDYDDTYTRDPELWNTFILSAKKRGHTVYCVTARSAVYTDQLLEVLETIGQLIGNSNCIFTDGKPKRPYCKANDIHIHIWIDDTPEAIPLECAHLFPDYD